MKKPPPPRVYHLVCDKWLAVYEAGGRMYRYLGGKSDCEAALAEWLRGDFTRGTVTAFKA